MARSNALAEIVGWGREMMAHPVEAIDGVAEVLDALDPAFRLVLITKSDLFHQESKVAESGLVDRLEAVEILNEKDEPALLGRCRDQTETFVMRHDGAVPAADEIEFLDAAASAQDSEVEAVASDSSPWAWLALGCVLAACVWFVASAGADNDPVGPVARATLDEEEPPGLDGQRSPFSAPSSSAAPVTPSVFGAWPNPPTDRDPYVVRIPGPAELPFEIAADHLSATTIVYVNSVGDPTVVSFETGDVYRVDVASIRVHETFAVEAGNVVSMGEANRSLDEGTGQAVVFHTYRDVDSPGVGTMGDERGVGRGPELCLSDSTCRRPGLGVERLVRTDLVVERFDQQQHWAIAELLDTWEPVDRWLVSPSGYRIPTPGAVIWVIGSPKRASSSLSGRI